jgi:hypothetical protein
VEDAFVSTGFSTVREELDNKEEKRVGFVQSQKENLVRHIAQEDFIQ